MPSAPSRFEVEHLHRLVIQASAEATRLEGRLGEAQTADALWPLLRHWHEAAGALDQAVARARGPLEQEGTPKDQIDRIRRRLAFLQQKSKQFDLEVDLDECVQSWNGLRLELAQLSGKQRDALVQALQERKPAIDRTTAMLSEALRHEGLLQEDLRKRTGLREERDRACARHERLRQAWLAAQRDWEAAHRQQVADPRAQQHQVQKVPVLDLRQGSQHGTSPAVVRLPLNRLLERGHHRMGAGAARVEKTLSHLATAEHRTLTDPTAGELRAHLARMDSVLARLSGKRGDELRDGAREVGTLLQRMSAIASRAGASAHVAPFRKLLEERKGQLRRLAQDSGGQPRRTGLWPPPPVRDPGHPLRELRGSNPGLDRLLRQSSQAQLAAELSKQSRAGLHSIPAAPAPRAASFAAATLAGFGGAHPTGLGALAGEGGALANALEKEMAHQRRREEPRETGEILAGLRPAPERTALRELARRAELEQKQLATRSARKGPPPSQITGAVLLDAAREHPKGRAFAAHLAPGGPLRALCETAQRGHGLPIGQAAQHYLASRGSSHLWNAVATFNALAKDGYTPRFSLGSWLRKNVSDPASHALGSLPGTVGQGALAAASLGFGAREGISSLGQRARGAVLDVARGGGLRGRKLPKHAGPLRNLEKALSNPRARRVIGALERAGSRGVKGGIWVSGKAARAQDALDKAVSAGEQVHGALSQVHDLAPGLAEALGDNAAGHFVARAGDWAGSSDDRLQKALGYGQRASGGLSRYRGYLDKGLGYAGVKDPAKAYEKMSARADLHAGRKGALEHLAQLELEDHRRKHPELHLAEATGMRARRVHGEEQLLPRKRLRREAGGLEKAIARGRELMTKGRGVAQGAHDKLGKVHDVVERGLSGAGRVQSGLEKAIGLARQGAGIFGEDSDLGRALLHAADRADQIHDHLETGIDDAQKFNQKVGATHDLLENIPAVEEKGEDEAPAYLEGGRRERSPHGHAEPPEAQVAPPQETEEQRVGRLRRAWERIGSVSSQVQRFEQESAKAQLRIEELLRAGKASEASTELMGLGSRCEQIDRAIREARTLSRGEEKYEKQVGFYQDWQRRTREKLHVRIADTQGLGGQVAISGFGIQETTHRDIFENTRAIYAVRTKVQSFAGALHDPDASGQVGKVLAEARKARSDLQALKAKYRKDKAAHEFLTGGGSQDKLIDEVLQKLAGAEKAAAPRESEVAGAAQQVSEMLGEDSALGQLARQLSEGGGKEQGKLHEVLDGAGKGQKFLRRGQEVFERVLELAEEHHAKDIGRGTAGEVREAPHEGCDLTAQDVQGAFEPLNGLHGLRPPPHELDRDAPARIETDGELTRPVSGDGGRTRHDPFSDLLDDMFAGGDARIHVDRGGVRLDLDELDLQDVDPAAMDTWIGSGEAVKLFSEVFGAFIPVEAAIVVHAGRSGGHGQGKGSEPGEPARRGRRRRRQQRGGFFARLFDQLEGFADRIGGWAKKGSRLLGKGMHFAELGMHGLSQIEGAAERVQGFAGRSEGFLERMGLHRLAGYAGWIGAAADGVDEEAKLLHGGLRTADQWMSKKATGVVEQGAHAAAGIFGQAAQGRPGALVNIFRASRNGDGIDGKLSPDRVPLGSVFDEPRRLDVSTLSRMGSFLGGDFSGVRIHTGPGAAEVTRRFNAEAVTVKDHIFFGPGRFNPATIEGQKLIAHELTHVLQKGRANLDVRTAEGEALHSEHSYGPSPSMETLNLRRPEPGFRIAADGEGMGASSGIHTAKRTRSRGDETGSKDTLPDGEDLLEQVSGRVYELLMEELEQGFQSR